MPRTLGLLASILTISALVSVAPHARQVGSLPTEPGAEGARTDDPVMGPRDRPRDTEGDARISGRVTDAETGRPLRRALVQLQGVNLAEGRFTSTDDHGSYVLDRLPAGTFTIAVTKGSYVPVGTGMSWSFDAPRIVEIAGGQRIRNLDFRLVRGGVIAGRVTDEFGEPVPNIGVRALRIHWMDGRRMLVPGGPFFSRETDDRGQYRIFGLMPGDYYVSASALDRQGGHMMAAGQTPEIDGALRTYFPGAVRLEDAQRVRVGPGLDALSVNFALDSARPLSISGTIVDSRGQTPGPHVWIAAEHSMDILGSGSGSQINPDGSFTIANMSPGDYILTVNVGEEEGESAEVPVSLTSDDITGLAVVTSPPVPISGQLLFETEPARPVGPQQFRFEAVTAPWSSLAQRARGHFGTKDDWTFETRAHRGPVLIRTEGLPDPWVLKAVLQNGVDVTDTGIDISRREPVQGVQIVLSSRPSTVSGTVTDERGRRITTYGGVLVFADDASRWGPFSRYMHLGVPNQNGRYSAGPIPPGHYLAVAVPRLDSERIGDPEYLEQLRGYATAFEIRDGEKRTLDLPLVAIR